MMLDTVNANRKTTVLGVLTRRLASRPPLLSRSMPSRDVIIISRVDYFRFRWCRRLTDRLCNSRRCCLDRHRLVPVGDCAVSAPCAEVPDTGTPYWQRDKDSEMSVRLFSRNSVINSNPTAYAIFNDCYSQSSSTTTGKCFRHGTEHTAILSSSDINDLSCTWTR